MRKNKLKIKKNWTFIIVCFLTLLCGCMLKYEDVSEEPRFAHFLKTSYSLKTDMFIYGVNLDPGYGKDIDIYIIKPLSMRTVGPEIISENTLKSATTLEVQSIRRSINSLFMGEKNIQAVVKVTIFEKSVNVPVVVDLDYIQSDNLMSKVGSDQN